MRSVDVVLSFPPLLFLLVLITGAGTSTSGARDRRRARAGAAHRARRPHGDARAVRARLRRGRRARGASGRCAILRREILPNILGPVIADVGLRLTYSIILVASVNFLGLGLQPPAADWALMISENRDGLDLNPCAILAPAVLIALSPSR